MLTHTALYTHQGMTPVTKDGHLTLLTDLSRDRVFLKGRVKNGPAFAGAMLILGKIVKTSARQGPKDHGAYQNWVQGQYLGEMRSVQARRIARLPALKEREAELRGLIKETEKEIREASDKVDDLRSINKFNNWLLDHNRDAWWVIDPIVSVQPDATFFEGFSLDESVYARIKLPADCMETDNPIQPGTTNIDFSIGLEKEFSRIRSYRPLDLTVGADAVTVETDLGSATEKKIDLPESWVRGLLEVQSALAIAPITFNATPAFVAEIISRLEAEKEKSGPRSLRFKLIPGDPIAVELEPWGEIITDRESCYMGSEVREIRVWGRRRLSLLKNLLPDASSVTVHLIDSGMPSFWTIDVDGIELQLGLSGWTILDWASKARFAAFMPSTDISDHKLTQMAALLKTHGVLSPTVMAAEAGIEVREALAALRKLSAAGKAMFDSDLNTFRWRELYPEFNLEKLNEAGLEERKGVELNRTGAAVIEKETIEGNLRKITAIVHDKTPQTTTTEIDVDGRVVYAECTCTHFRYHKLRQGPCRHMVAVALN